MPYIPISILLFQESLSRFSTLLSRLNFLGKTIEKISLLAILSRHSLGSRMHFEDDVTYEELDQVTETRLQAIYRRKNGLIRVNPGAVILPTKYRDVGSRIRNMEVRESDVWVVSYPRTGSTWTQEMVWCIGNGLDYEKSRTVLAQFRNPLLELTIDEGAWMKGLGHSVDLVESLPSPRFIKTHLAIGLLPKQLFTVKPKVIYVARNAKDVCVSYYHFSRLFYDISCTFQEFSEIFRDGQILFGPYWSHVLGFWQLRDDPNILFLKYEEIKQDHKRIIRRTARFMGVDLTDEQVDSLEKHLSFESTKSNSSLNWDVILQAKKGPDYKQEDKNHFVRKGKVGSWRESMSVYDVARFDEWTELNLKGSGLDFKEE